ncbi:hypothetical protein O3P69_008930 [Scylla paramamosain]|uniref:Uncharacterized protein n=1 Tax=Scylla paramamosain TaxID=85552 RepID=A0AAW0TQH8_SCYPA
MHKAIVSEARQPGPDHGTPRPSQQEVQGEGEVKKDEADKRSRRARSGKAGRGGARQGSARAGSGHGGAGQSYEWRGVTRQMLEVVPRVTASADTQPRYTPPSPSACIPLMGTPPASAWPRGSDGTSTSVTKIVSGGAAAITAVTPPHPSPVMDEMSQKKCRAPTQGAPPPPLSLPLRLPRKQYWRQRQEGASQMRL